jgi:hypothetical protein
MSASNATRPILNDEWSQDLVEKIDMSFPLRKKNSKRAEQIRKKHAVSRELRSQMGKSMQNYRQKSLRADSIGNYCSSLDKTKKEVEDKQVQRDATAVGESLNALADFLQSMQHRQQSDVQK